jgi:GntR family carbon starvation induced transcriptional regulator
MTNERSTFMMPGQSLGPKPAANGSSALDRLRKDILTGIFEPGKWLRLIELRERYSLGASPLREALSKLAAEQLLVQEANRGFRVPKLDKHEFRDIFFLRRKLEPEATRSSVLLGDAEWEDQLVLTFRRLKRLGPPDEILAPMRFDERVQEWEQAHRNFHRTLIKACDSPWTQRFCLTLSDQFDRYRRFARPSETVQKRLAEQHQTILDAALKRDADACAKLVDDHVVQTAEAVMAAIDDLA